MNSERAGWCARFADAWLPTAVWSWGRRTSDLWGDASCSLAQQTTSSVLWHVEEHKHGVNNYTHLLIIKGFRVALGSKFVFFSAVLTVINQLMRCLTHKRCYEWHLWTSFERYLCRGSRLRDQKQSSSSSLPPTYCFDWLIDTYIHKYKLVTWSFS